MSAGAQTTLYCAVSPNVRGSTGKYFDNCRESKPTSQALNGELAKQLWEASEKMLGIVFTISRKNE
jgi:hypothetical protein